MALKYNTPVESVSQKVDTQMEEDPNSKASVWSIPQRHSPLARCSNVIVNIMETGFYKLGFSVGRYPWWVMLVCLMVVGVCCGGFAFFREETDQELLWSPKDSQAAKDQKWVERNFGNRTFRPETILLVAEDILDPTVLLEMLRLDKNVKAISKADSYDWETLCERLGVQCWSNSLLELWSFDEAAITALTKQDILDKVNSQDLRSPVYFNKYDVANFLGGIQRDQNGRIVSAEATTMTWMLQNNGSKVQEEKEEDWEANFLKLAKKTQEENNVFQELQYFASRSLRDEINNAVFPDLKLLAMGYVIVFIFAALVLGKFNMLEQKILITVSGVLCVGFSTAIAVGLCSYFGMFFANIHFVLPFLLLGIGVDHMFVIAQSLQNVQAEGKDQDLSQPEKMARTLKHAGVSIAVSSLTDALAFGVGATTILPALHAFCIFAVVGILAILVFQTLFFTACLTLDLRRQEMRRDACCICYVHSATYTPNKCSQTELIPTFFSRVYAPFLTSNPVRICVIVWAIALVAVMAWGTANLRQDQDENRFFRYSSYASKYGMAKKQYFPGDGVPSAVYIGDIDYIKSRVALEELYQNVLNDPYTYPGTVVSWHRAFYQWLAAKGAQNDPGVVSLTGSDFYPTNEADFYQLLLIFMCTGSMEGARFSSDIHFSVGSACVPGNKIIQSSRMTLRHKNVSNSYEEILAMESLRDVVTESNLPARAFSYKYPSFETNKVIQHELYRNLGLAFLSVLLMTLVLLADLWMCLLVCLCVLMTLVDLAGLMHFWGLTIDVVTAVQFILAVGLAVDYAVHIAHTFMTVSGNREERTKNTLHCIGAAVFYGGFSTFLAFVLLCASGSYIFVAFFKVFFGVVVFGLFHGLMFLPALLSAIGPAPYLSADDKDSDRSAQAKEPTQEPETDDPRQPRDDRTSQVFTVPSPVSSMEALTYPYPSVRKSWQVSHWVRVNATPYLFHQS